MLHLVPANHKPRPPASGAAVAGGAAIALLALFVLGLAMSVMYPLLRALGRLPGWALCLVPLTGLTMLAHRNGLQYLADCPLELDAA